MSKCIVKADQTLDTLEHLDDPIKIFERSRLVRSRPKNDPSLSQELETVALSAVVSASDVKAVSQSAAAPPVPHARTPQCH